MKAGFWKTDWFFGLVAVLMLFPGAIAACYRVWTAGRTTWG